jgi:hypothetical protein
VLHEGLDERVRRRRLEALVVAGRRQRVPQPRVEHVLDLQLDVVLHLRVEGLLLLFFLLVWQPCSGHRPLRLRPLVLAPATDAALQ